MKKIIFVAMTAGSLALAEILGLEEMPHTHNDRDSSVPSKEQGMGERPVNHPSGGGHSENISAYYTLTLTPYSIMPTLDLTPPGTPRPMR